MNCAQGAPNAHPTNKLISHGHWSRRRLMLAHNFNLFCHILYAIFTPDLYYSQQHSAIIFCVINPKERGVFTDHMCSDLGVRHAEWDGMNCGLG